MTGQTRTIAVVAICVLALHVAALCALQFGLMTRKPDFVAPVQLLARIVEPPRPVVTGPQPVVAPERAAPMPTAPMRKQPTLKAAPVPIAIGPTPPKPEATAPEPAPMPAVAEPAAAPVDTAATTTAGAGKPSMPRQAVEPAPASAPADAVAPVPQPMRPIPLAVELPSSDAQYLQNPRPQYPPISLRLREQGTVLVEVLVSDQGFPEEARVQTSSGFFRLDQIAVSTVLSWRFVPGKRGGVAQSMWHIVPIEFSIR